MSKVYVHSFDTKIGTIRTAATSKGLALVSLPGTSARAFNEMVCRDFPDCARVEGGALNRQAERELNRYLDGNLRQFTVKLDVQGTPFQRKVLAKVAVIDYGQTMTYGEIARAVGHPGAARAVGSVNASNRLPLIVPCHRVVATNGLGGYGGGLKMKKELLMLEGAGSYRLEV